MTDDKPEQRDPFEHASAEVRYAAFADVPGFGAKVADDFDAAFQKCREILNNWRWHREFSPEVTVRIYSDAIALTSKNLGQLIGALVTLHVVTLKGDYLIRGGVGSGRHIEVSEGDNLYVVSEALTKAAARKKGAGWPCVALCEDIRIPPQWWDVRLRNIQRGVLYFDGLTIVNPLNIYWGHAAQDRVRQLAAAHPNHRSEYEWLLRLTEAIFSDSPLVPPWVMEQNSPPDNIIDLS
ncbi:MAG: hypothetical protein OEW04_04590 [Nitrospirota bacterium]|nr:hypothetical protein [Nitrospirota bacterium]